MKLNNKGFAITAVLYGLLILFVVLVSSYLLVLSAKKDRVDSLVNNIEEEYQEHLACNKIIKEITFPYTTLNKGKYIFNITVSGTNTSKNCEIELEKNITIEYESGRLKQNNNSILSDLMFLNEECNTINTSNNINSINKVTYKCE